jgi:chromosome segregation ATPase
MISLLPASSPAETSAAYTLLAVIADPKAAKQRLDDLVTERTALEGNLKDLQVATAKHVDDVAKAYGDLSAKEDAVTKREQDVTASVAKSDAAHAVRAKQLNDHEAVLAQTSARVEGHEAQVTKREKDVAGREAAVEQHSLEVTARDAHAYKVLNEATTLKAAYEGKEAALKAALSAAPKAFTLAADTGQLGASMSGAK